MVGTTMPITFKSRHCPDIIMLETVGLELIKLMGHSGTVPGSLAVEDIPGALERLEKAVTAAPERALDSERRPQGEDDDREPVVTLSKRALPLIAMLKSAIEEQDYVIWAR